MEIRLKSIDLGQESLIGEYEDIDDYRKVGFRFHNCKGGSFSFRFHPKYRGLIFNSLRNS
jgi:hypothetical protein